MKIYHTRFNNFLEMNDLGEQIEIFAKSTSKIFLKFAIRKPSTDDPEFTLDTSIIPIPPLIESIVHAIEDIFYRQSNAFKMNLSFSFILQHRETGEFRYHYASNNSQILNSPRLIRNQKRFRKPVRSFSFQRFPLSP